MTMFQVACIALATLFLIWLGWKIGWKLMKYVAAAIAFLATTAGVVLIVYMIIRGIIMIFTIL